MKIRIILKSFDKETIKNVSKKIHTYCKSIKDCRVSGFVALPTQKKQYCVLSSPHVDKDSREQFELRIYKSFIDITPLTIRSVEPILNMPAPIGAISSSIEFWD